MNGKELLEEQVWLENRAKNLFWTVCGDYARAARLDAGMLQKAKPAALYEAARLGALYRYFDAEQVIRFTAKGLQSAPAPMLLAELVRICVDAAVYPKLQQERPGMELLRRRAFAALLQEERLSVKKEEKGGKETEREIASLEGSPDAEQDFFAGLRNAFLEAALGEQEEAPDGKLTLLLEEIDSLAQVENTEELIAGIGRIYGAVCKESLEGTENCGRYAGKGWMELSDTAWEDCLTEEEMEQVLEEYRTKLKKEELNLEREEGSRRGGNYEAADWKQMKQPEQDWAQARAKVESYLAQNYGNTFLTKQEQREANRKYCRGIHADCTLYVTEGILHSAANKNNQYRFSQLQFEKNRMYYYNAHWMVKRNIANLADALKRLLALRQEEIAVRARTGKLRNAWLWRAERTGEQRLFRKKQRAENHEFVVDLLLDSSGSQAGRQPQVAVQGYMISAALSEAGILHRVTGYCSFWDHTILQRYRDYADGAEYDFRVLEFRASGDNRDGLVLRAVSESLAAREEANKILIVLSDGRPNDLSVNRPGTRRPAVYTGEAAARDTALEVRRARALGISVFGIFAGADEDLAAEQKIYGKDFARIRNISSFSQVVGAYLRKQLERE